MEYGKHITICAHFVKGHAECMNMQYLHELRSKTVLNTWPSIRDVPHGYCANLASNSSSFRSL